MNAATAFIDLGPIYGNSHEELNKRRGKGGEKSKIIMKCLNSYVTRTSDCRFNTDLTIVRKSNLLMIKRTYRNPPQSVQDSFYPLIVEVLLTLIPSPLSSDQITI